ncbi:MAG: translation initiation factor IF-2 [Bacteroidales bacterium]|nr:translation initiation factor IF-2 [Bacteroidales bacterium]
MSEGTASIRLSKAAREFNIGISTVLEFLNKKGFKLDRDPNAKLSQEMYSLLMSEFASEKHVKEEAKKIGLQFGGNETITIADKRDAFEDQEKEMDDLMIKNVSLGFGNKPSEVVRKEEPAKVKETPARPKPAVEEKPAAAPEKAEEKDKEIAPAPEKEEIIVAEADIQPVAAEEAIKEEPKSSLKILGKMDLTDIGKKGSKKGKEKKEEEKTKKEVTARQEPVAAVEVPEVIAPSNEVPEEAVPEIPAAPVEEAPVPPVRKAQPDNFLATERIKLEGPTILGSMILPETRKPEKKQPVASSSDDSTKSKKKKRKRIKRQPGEPGANIQDTASKGRPGAKKTSRDVQKPEISEEDIERQIKETLSRLSPSGKSKASKYRRQKREAASQHMHEEQERIEEGKRVIQVTEFVTANELATMINVAVTDVISTCMTLGMFVSINQRLDAETLSLVAEEFGYKVEFVSVEVQEAIDLADDTDEMEGLVFRPPIVTVMGHVDHGKTKLLDYIRSANVVAGEAGGITQHIGAYEVQLENGKEITFLDTPGHEAFTAMRARGAKVTDVTIVVIAADETVMPQTKEAINHAQAAGVPIVFAINKMDKPNANSEKIREELSKMNILVEEWGGKYQTQEISAKEGTNVNLLLEKVLLEAEMLDLKANPDKMASGTVIESSLDKGRGYVSKLLVQSGTLKMGDIVLAGSTYGKVKAMYNERNQAIKTAGPSTPVLLLGLNGAPQAGDGFNVLTDEREAKTISNKRLQLQREQGIRTQKHITLDEIGRRIAIGDFKELNIIVKADVDGSVEALADSLIKLSTQNVVVNVIHKSVGQITESDVLLASASNAIIVGFQVRPSVSARKLAEQEQIDIRLYSIIYQAIEEIKAAIEGMLAPEIEEKILCNVEVRDVFRITKVGTIAGCLVLDGKITRNTKVRIIRDGIVVYTGHLASLKRFKDDVKEVNGGYECGLNIESFNDIKVGDIIEGYEIIEVKRKL